LEQQAARRLWAGVGVALACACLVQFFAGIALLGLQADGAYCLRVLLSRQDFACIDPARRAVQALLEAPTLGAVALGVRDLPAAGAIFSLSLQLMPILLTALACALAPSGQRRLMLLPAFAYFAGASSVASIGMNEGPTATAFFWTLFFAMLTVPPRALPLALLVLGALAALFAHEVMALLAPVLVWAAWRRAPCPGAGPGVGPGARVGAARTVFRGLAVWFVIVTITQWVFVVWPHNVANRDGFLTQTLTLKFLAGANGLNVPAVLGLLAACGLVATWRWPRAGLAIAACFAGIALVLTGAALAWDGWFLAPAAQFYARNLPALLSVPLAVLAAATMRRPGMSWPRDGGIGAGGILTTLAAATIGYQLIQIAAWADTIAAFRAALHGPAGLVAWEDAVAATPAPRRAALLRADWGWTMPDLSIVLSGNGDVRRLIANPRGRGWQPWDPRNPAAWPAGTLFRIDLPRAP
jgi:hypothetical protein